MQHFAKFSSQDAEKEGGSWARDAAIGGIEGALGYAVTEPLVHKLTGGVGAAPKLSAKKVAISAGTGALGTLAVGAGLNAVGGLLKGKKKEDYHAQPEQPQQQSSRYGFTINHFADFALTPEKQQTANSLNYLRQNDLEEFNRVNQAGKQVAKQNRQGIQNKISGEALRLTNENVNAGMSSEEAQKVAAQKAEQSRATIAKEANKNYNQKFVRATNANQASGFIGKTKNTLGRGLKAVGGAGGLMTAAYLAPTLLSLLPNSQKQQQEEEQY